MRNLVFAFLTFALALTAAQARPWDSADGNTYDVYMVRSVDDDGDRFAIMALFFDAEGASLNDVINLSDSLFEEALIHFAAEQGLRAAVVRFSPRTELAEGELPEVLADVRYETNDNQHWDRVNFLEVPVGESTLFPSAPVTQVTLSSGEVLNVEPATVLFPGSADRKELNVRAVYPLFVIDEENGNRVMALLWDEVVRPMAMAQAVNNVSVAVYSGPPEGRFDYRPAYGGVFSKRNWETWPTYARMSEAGAN